MYLCAECRRTSYLETIPWTGIIAKTFAQREEIAYYDAEAQISVLCFKTCQTCFFFLFLNYLIILVMPCPLCEIRRGVYSSSSEGVYLRLLPSDNVNLSVCCSSCRGRGCERLAADCAPCSSPEHFHGLTSISNHFGFYLFFLETV